MSRPARVTWVRRALLAIGLVPACVCAQSTDAYRSVQLFPIVVDSASFAQRFTFRAPGTVTLQVVYYAAEQAVPVRMVCGEFSVVSNRSFSSLREICPGLGAGTQYGMLRVAQIDANAQGFAGFSRVSNPEGNGFTVEAVGADEFLLSTSHAEVLGLKRQAATAGSPAFQTNCFYGIFPHINFNAAPPPHVLNISIRRTGAPDLLIARSVRPGTLFRLLDVFAAVGAPPGDVPDAQFLVEGSGSFDTRAIVAFCTVQDNTSFGADFRIGKHREFDSPRQRFTSDSNEVEHPPGFTQRSFELGTGIGNKVNTHVIYFRHPDRIGCRLHDPVTAALLTPTYGLEMRLVEGDGTTVVAGGNNITGFSGVYLGDKPARNFGANGRYSLQVESNGQGGAFEALPYDIHCESGSGHSRPDLIRYQQSGNTF